MMHLEDSVATDLHVAMAVRREGVKGERTPPGILTQLRGTSVGRLIEQIEKTPDPLAIELGFQLLKLSSSTGHDISGGIDKVVAEAAKDNKGHDVTVGFGGAKSGITIHCNDLPDDVAASRLKRHSALRKYSQKAVKWFGMLLRPGSSTLRMALMLNYPWKADKSVEKLVDRMPKGLSPKALRRFSVAGSTRKKIGRNEPCLCGSGLKYKKCCLGKTAV
jgi:hypothetical protein